MLQSLECHVIIVQQQTASRPCLIDLQVRGRFDGMTLSHLNTIQALHCYS